MIYKSWKTNRTLCILYNPLLFDIINNLLDERSRDLFPQKNNISLGCCPQEIWFFGLGGINFPLSLTIREHHAVNRVSIEIHSNSIFYHTLADNVSPVADANTSNNGETSATNGQPKVCVLSPILDCNWLSQLAFKSCPKFTLTFNFDVWSSA